MGSDLLHNRLFGIRVRVMSHWRSGDGWRILDIGQCWADLFYSSTNGSFEQTRLPNDDDDDDDV